MRPVAVEELLIPPFEILDRRWALLVAGREHPNPMTVSWGAFGTLWNLPVATVFVRPTRYTFGLLERDPFFTLNFLPPEHRPALQLCGSRSGRDCDKWAATGLNTAPSGEIPVPRVAQATLSLECRVLAVTDLQPGGFLDGEIERHYPDRDYHRVYFGHVLGAWQAPLPGSAAGEGAGQ